MKRAKAFTLFRPSAAYHSLLASCIIFIAFSTSGKGKDAFYKCCQKQVGSLQDRCVSIDYEEIRHSLGHNFKPWQTSRYASKGCVACNAKIFTRHDSIIFGGTTYRQMEQLNDSELFLIRYGDKELSGVTREMVNDEMFETARYAPGRFLAYIAGHAALTPEKDEEGCKIYQAVLQHKVIRFYIKKSGHLLQKTTILENSDWLGDLLTTYRYEKYRAITGYYYPAVIHISKYNGQVEDTITVNACHLCDSIPLLIRRPADYTIGVDEPVKPQLKVEKYDDHISFIHLVHTKGRAMVVEFKDFVLVAEAPLNSENGELILNEVHKIAPGKPVKYFIFSHFHPDYTGGMRAFVHKGATVLCSKPDSEFVQYLAHAAHTLKPDSEQLQPRPLKMECIEKEKTISDGSCEMQIYFIGSKSKHTNDYLVYYFPREKMLFEGDLVWVSDTGQIAKANPRQKGLYNAIKDLGLDVKTVVQSWPVSGYHVKTIIPFEDLEKSMARE